MTIRLLLGLWLLFSYAAAQRRVDPRNTYNRIVCVVPLVGSGTAADPKRPLYAPWPASQDANGIIGFSFVPSDDGKFAVVEFVARNRGAFTPLLNDKSVKLFEKGKSPRSDIESALKVFRKDFDSDKYGMVMP